VWTARKVAPWVQAHTGQRMAEVTAWTYLRRLGCSLQRPRHTRAAGEEAFKKSSPGGAQRQLHPDKPVGVWSQDEARVGLKPILCRVWALKGQRPLAFHRTREWLYVYLFVHPASGRSTFLILPTVNSEPMRLALREFQQEVNPEGRKVLLLNLPPYTPGLSPAEGGAFAAGSGGQWEFPRLGGFARASGRAVCLSPGAPRGHPGWALPPLKRDGCSYLTTQKCVRSTSTA